jgi:hypothetical protein
MPTLKLNGKTLDLNPTRPTVLRIRSFLDKQADDEVFTTDGLAELMKRTPSSIRHSDVARDKALESYRLQRGKSMHWGNPKAIKELRKQTGTEK